MIVEMHDIVKDYATGKNVTHVLRGVNLSVEEGEYLAIMGPSGSGKSTLMNILGFLDVPTSGTYLFDGQDMANSTDNQLADVRNKDIGFVFQSFHLLPKLTALDNAALPLLYGNVAKQERRDRAAEALKTVGLEERMNHLPTELSGGQQQRVAIARAIVGNPKLLLADEPTGALDSESGRMILELFRGLHEAGSTIIMITHDRKVAEHADRIVYIYDGMLTDEETYRKLINGETAERPALTEPEADAAAPALPEPETLEQTMEKSDKYPDQVTEGGEDYE